MGEPIILYDSDCGFCKWSLSKLLAWDRRGRLRPLALQDPEADVLLAGMEADRKMASWHLVDGDGRVHSAGAAIAPLMRLLPGGSPVARLASASPALTERAYAWVADHRAVLGRLLRRIAGEAAVERAVRRIEERRCRPAMG